MAYINTPYEGSNLCVTISGVHEKEGLNRYLEASEGAIKCHKVEVAKGYKTDIEHNQEEQTIEIKSGLFEVALNKQEITQMYEDVQWLEDAVKILLNPELLKSWDYNYSSIEELRKDFEEYLKESKS